MPAILYHTRDLFFLADGDLAVITPNGVQLSDFDGQPVTRQVQHITWDPIMAEKGGFKHFMLKEIYEQPRAVRDTTLGRVSLDSGKVFLDEMDITEEEFRKLSKVYIAACGTSWHAGLAGKFMIERLAKRAGGSGLRQRVPLSRSADRPRRSDHADHAVGRNRRHHRRPARSRGQGRQDTGHLQRGGLHDRARSRMAPSTRTPGRRSAWPPPRPSRAIDRAVSVRRVSRRRCAARSTPTSPRSCWRS